jgi:5-methylcytosine-specific restriction protein A
MPLAFNKPCLSPGCTSLARGGHYCDAHRVQKRKAHDHRRGSSAARGYGYRWQVRRAEFLGRAENALCRECEREGIVTPATDVDHLIPVDGPDDPLFWVEENWDPKCHAHHSQKTVRENRGFGRPSHPPFV